MAVKCSTCSTSLVAEDNFVQFLCPKCLSATITRCERCRRASNPYRCACGYEGP